jgi:Cu(I)/Ag(I) efflux system membrane fusion protein
MNKKALIGIAVVVISIGLAFYFSKPALLKGKTLTAVKAPEPAEHQEPKAQPQQTSPQEQTVEETPAIEITPEQQRLMGVKTVEVLVKPLQKIIRTVGRIEYDESRLATVNTKFEGWIEKLYINYTGRYVKKGEPLAEIYSLELYATQQEFINLLKWKNSGSRVKGQGSGTEIDKMLSRDAESIIEAAKQRLRLWNITDEQIKKIEESEKPIRTLAIYSPVSGYVIQKTALQGMRVMPGEKLFDVADLSSVWIISDIYEYELPLIKVGQTAKIALSYAPDREFQSKIDYVYPALSGETRTAKVRFTIPNPDGRLKPQMFTNVEVKIDLGKRLAIPDDAVIDTGTRQIIYVDKGDGYFEPREVMLGLRAEGLREVVMGLKAGEKVASSATFLIDSEAQLKGVKPLGHKH